MFLFFNKMFLPDLHLLYTTSKNTFLFNFMLYSNDVKFEQNAVQQILQRFDIKSYILHKEMLQGY